MQRFLSLIMTVCILLPCLFAACAESLSYIPCDCGRDPCVCFLQTLDQGPIISEINKRLRSQGYIKDDRVSQFTREILDATLRFQADHGLPITGTWDDTSLTVLIWGVSPEELDEAMPPMAGRAETYPDICYVPSDGGHKRHSDPLCSEMYDPRKVSIRNAAALGFDACSKCEMFWESILATKYPKPPEEGDEMIAHVQTRLIDFSIDTEESQVPEQAEITYIVNKNSKKFHYPDCSGVQTMKENNRLEVTCTREELIDQGYQPCGTCKP